MREQARAVVVTRPRAQAGPLLDAVKALGREAVALPLLEIEPLADPAELKGVLARLEQYALVAFVSPNAIDAAFAYIDGWPAGVAIAVLGEGSRACLAAHGVDDSTATIVSPLDAARSDSEHLMAAIDAGTLAGRKVLIVRGESGRELIADGMRAAGAEVTTVAAYRRRVPDLTPALAAQLSQLIEHRCDWIVTSSEALRGLFALLERLGGANAVAKMQQQHLIVPHARIAETAASLGVPVGAGHLTLSGSGDASLLAALQSRA